MAVQAQYPSNVLFLNRNVQEVKEMLAGEYPMQSLQSHQTSGYLDQTNMLFSSGVGAGSSSRKRGREAPINLFSLQSQPPPPTLVNLAQLHTPPPAPAPASAAPAACVVSTGLGLSLQDQQQEQQLGLAKQSSSHLPSSLLNDLAAQINQQNEEIDQFLRAQADQLRRALGERYRVLLGAAEESAQRQLRLKEAEVETAARRRAELEERVGRMEAEAQAWRARARAQEAAAAALQVKLRQAMSTAAAGTRPVAGEQDGGEEPGGAAVEDAESAHVDPDRVEVVATAAVPPACRACRRRYVSVVLMPCRHLCVCEECESVVRTCPICRVPSSGGVQVYL